MKRPGRQHPGRQYPGRRDENTSLHTASHLAHVVRRLSRASLPSDTAELAKYLIGKTIVRKIGRNTISGRIVETEAYPPGDSSGHAYRGRTPRNQTLFLRRGFAYVYFIYGTSYMLNVSAEEPGIGAGVLLRAIEPLEGIDLMKRFRKTDKLRDLARGPGRLAAALQIDRRLDGVDLCANGPLWLGTAVRETAHVSVTVRIGITREVHRPLRFFEAGSPFVSGPSTRTKRRHRALLSA
jgi:DNA-3-methyladenine glycosylase